MKNGPALAGRGAEAVRDAITEEITGLPGQLLRSLTWDQGTELAQHAQLHIDTGVRIYFADPHSPWQRGTNENTNGLLRQYFPKGTDLSRWRAEELAAVAFTLNTRPRKILGWKTPAEAFSEHLNLLLTAVLRRLLEPKQYTSWAFGRRLRAAGLLGSMGSIGDCYDNSVVESFFGTLQLELLDQQRWDTRQQLVLAIFDWIECWYNPRRRHSYCDRLSPADYEHRHTTGPVAA